LQQVIPDNFFAVIKAPIDAEHVASAGFREGKERLLMSSLSTARQQIFTNGMKTALEPCYPLTAISKALGHVKTQR